MKISVKNQRTGRHTFREGQVWQECGQESGTFALLDGALVQLRPDAYTDYMEVYYGRMDAKQFNGRLYSGYYSY